MVTVFFILLLIFFVAIILAFLMKIKILKVRWLKTKNETLITIAAILIFFTISVIVFYGDFRYTISSIMHPSKICFPDSSKNKVTILIAKNGIYDNEKISLQVSKYFDSVKKDLNIDNAGLQKFPGKTIEELDRFVDDLYLNDDVGYIVLVGDDLPIVIEKTVEILNYTDTGTVNCLVNDSVSGEVVLETSAAACMPGRFASLDTSVDEKISCVNGGCLVRTESCASEVCPIRKGNDGYWRCRDVGISYILPPLLYSESEKVDFVLKILSTYTDYHNNFDIIISKYQRSVFDVVGVGLLGKSKPMIGYYLPIVALQNTDGEKISSELKNKHLVLFLGVHGSPQELLFSIGIPNQGSISLDEYSNFAKENGLPALFVDPGQCHALDVRYEDLRHCCWPQIFLESGVWAYYAVGYGQGIEAKLTHEKTIGLAVRKSSPIQIFIFGSGHYQKDCVM